MESQPLDFHSVWWKQWTKIRGGGGKVEKNLTFSHAKERKVTLLLARHCSCGVTVVISLVLLEVRAGVRSA